MKNFREQLPICVQQECEIARLLAIELGTIVITQIHKSNPDYDGVVLDPDTFDTDRKKVGVLFRYELKDERVKSKLTGNHFLEMVSRDKNSGISVTKSDIWIIQINNNTYYLTQTNMLKEQTTKGKWKIVRGGDKHKGKPTSIGMLIPLSWIAQNKTTILKGNIGHG